MSQYNHAAAESDHVPFYGPVIVDYLDQLKVQHPVGENAVLLQRIRAAHNRSMKKQ